MQPLTNKNFPETIKFEDLLLRKHTLDSAPIMFSYVDKDRERLREFLPWVDLTNTVEDEIEFIKMTHEKWGEGALFGFSIFVGPEEIYVGNVGVHTISWAHYRCEIGYWILGEHEGKGIMSRAVSALEQACFEMGFHRVEIRCSSLNKKSANIPKRLRYNLDGLLREDAIENGTFRSTLVYSKLNGQHKS